MSMAFAHRQGGLRMARVRDADAAPLLDLMATRTIPLPPGCRRQRLLPLASSVTGQARQASSAHSIHKRHAVDGTLNYW